MKRLGKTLTQDVDFIFVCPALLWQFLFLYTPFAILALNSIIDYVPTLKTYIITFSHYSQIFNSLYFRIILQSFFLAALTSLLCFFIAYPVAYFLALKVPKRYKTYLLFLLILPSWTSLIVQVYAWFFLLEKNGFISQTLQTLGIISPSYNLLNNYFTIVLVMISCYLPFMILPIYAVLEKMNKNYLEASADLGANRFETFRRIVFPLSMSGVYAGILLVFIPSFGEYAIPSLVGGSKYVFWGSVIVEKFLRSRDWQVGSALVIVGIMVPVLAILSAYTFSLLRRKRKAAYDHDIFHPNNESREMWG